LLALICASRWPSLEPVLNFLKKCLYIVNTSGHYAWDGEAKKTVSE
jgi:hypothetical protein